MALSVLVLAAVLVALGPSSAQAAPPTPHVLVFVADDMGWANWGKHNAEPITPNMNKLAADGVVLDRHYVFWYCSPTRSSLMSGRLPMHVSEDNGNADTFVGPVPVNMTMLPAKLKKSATPYATHHVGKWHLGQIRFKQVPGERGFDTALSYLGGAEDHYTQINGGCGCTAVDLWDLDHPGHGLNGTYGDYLFSQRAVQIIEQHNPDKPFMMYYASQTLHAPQEVPDKYANMYPSSKYSDDFRIEQGMATIMDEALGNITDALKAKGMWDNTLLVFLSDNGGPTAETVSGHSANNYPLRGGKRTAWEGGVRVNAFVSGGVVPASQRGSTREGYIHVADWYATICHLAGVDPTDNVTGVPPIDSLNMWDYVTGATPQSPRTEIPLVSGTNGALIVGDYKIVRGSQDYAFWTGPIYPNSTTDHKHEPAFNCGKGCLFNIIEDPTEHNDLAASMPDKLAELLQRAEELDKTAYLPNRGSGNRQQCCEATKKYGGFTGPYLDQ